MRILETPRSSFVNEIRSTGVKEEEEEVEAKEKRIDERVPTVF